ncbi:MAG: hypothetical protein HDR09_15150 [Lachnospiraceae bacterium]|nr:hypothetical protein [Lachnospiraceae bacterium]
MKKYNTVFISTFIIPYILLAVFIFLIDPYYVFHAPLFRMDPIRTDQPHYVARGLIRNMDYDILMCGSSMCENMHTDYIDAVFGGTSIKVVQHGSYSNDFASSLKQAAKSGKAQMIIMGLDSNMWKKPSEGYRIDDIPKYAVESPNIINAVPYLFNIGNLRPCFDLIKANQNKNFASMDSWWAIGDGAYSKGSLAADWAKLQAEGYSLPEIDETLAWANYNNLIEGIKDCENKGITIKFFIPPYSVADFSLYDYKHDLEIDKEIWRNLLQYDNIELYAIQFDTDLIQCFEWYRNTCHYNGLVCDMIINDIANKEFLLTEDNIDEQVDTFEQFLDGYDWNGLEALLAE